MKRKLKTILMGFLVLCGVAAQAKTVVNYPTVESKPYTGSEQTPTVPESPDYDVISASSGTGVGGYDIYLALTDSDNTKWPDTDEEVGTMKWYITKAANAWTTEPSIESWTYVDPASTPVAAAKFGTPTVTFSGTAKDGTTYTDVTSVAKAGTYTCKFTVAGTDNYEGLDPVVKNFEIKVAVPGGGGGGSGNVNISVTGYDGPYDGKDHQINVSITGEDAPTFSVGYSETQEGPFQSDNSFKYKEIGTHTVWYRLQSVNYATVTNSAVVKISQREITPPTVAPKEYNGEPQSADVTETADYTVEYNGMFTDAGTHENAVVLALKDSVHCKWADGAEDPVLLSFTITKSSGNVWLTEPSIAGWKYGESAHVPVAVPKYGVVSVLYDGTTTDGVEIKDAMAVSKAGSYTAKFTVPETTSYNGLSKNVTFEIERGKIDIGGGGGSGGAKLEVGNYTGTYDGDEHTASIAVTGDDTSSFTLTYSLEEAGVYTPNKPTFSNACETTKIWYSVSSPDYQTITNYATVAIDKRKVMLTSATDSKKYTGTALTAQSVTVSGDGWAGEEDATYDVTGSQTIVGTSKNTFSYSLKDGAKEQNYTINKVEGDLTVTEGDIVFTTQDYSAEYDGNGHSIGVTVTTPAGLKPKYALAQGGPYAETIPLYTNACNEIVVWYALEAQYYASVTNSAKVTITKRTLAAGMVDAIVDQTYTGSEIKPALTFTDEGNRKVTTDDYTAVYSSNKNVGQATVTITATATGNYSGTVVVHFAIVKATYDMTSATWSSDAGFIYDGTEKSVTVSGLPSGVTVASYANNRKTHADTYTASVTFAFDTENYNEPVLAGKEWTIGKRSVTIKSRSDSKPYDETPLVNKNVDVASGSFVGDEGLDYNVTGSQTEVGESDNEYTYTFKSNTLESDYTITKQCGKLKVVDGGIAYTAENYNAEYDGDGHSIVVKVTKPAGIKPKYALAQNGAYSESLPLYTNVCQDVVVWYALEAPNCVSVTNSAKVTITKRPLTAGMVNVIDDQTYTGSELEPALTFTDEGNRKITSEDYTAVYSNNRNVGQATVTITATEAGNYSGTVTVNFKIVKAKINDGEEPGGGSVPAGGVSKFDKTFEYDGKGHTIDTNEIVKSFGGCVVGGAFAVQYAVGDGAPTLPWVNVPPAVTNVCVTSVWYKVSAANYEDFVHEVRLTVKPRDIAKATIAPIAAVEYAGVPVKPVPTVTDGDPSIITTGDYLVAYSNNDAPGTATLTLTGKGNYTGTKSANFTITAPDPKFASLTGAIAWKLNLGSGCYTAQLKLACTNGFESGISNLRYLFADRTSGSKTSASLWDSSSRSARETTIWRDATYRCVSLDAAKLSRQGVSALYGVKDVSQSKGVIAQDECTIELYLPSLAVPSAYEGLVVWTSGGSDHALVISASGGAKLVPEPTTESATPVEPILATVTPAVMPTATTEELGLRNVFTSKNTADKVLADAFLATWKGTYVMAYPEIDEDGVTNGWNTFSIKIGARWRTIVAGILANGKSVSASAQMLVGDEWCKIVVSSTCKVTTFAFGLWLSRDGDILEVEGVDGAVIDMVGNLTGESEFGIPVDRLASLLGADAEITLGDVLPEAVPVTLKGSRWIVPTAGTVRVVKTQLDYSLIRENPSALRLTFTKTTGRFMGSFKVYLWDGKKLKPVSAAVKGIVVGGIGYGTAKHGKYGTMSVSVVPVEAE